MLKDCPSETCCLPRPVDHGQLPRGGRGQRAGTRAKKVIKMNAEPRSTFGGFGIAALATTTLATGMINCLRFATSTGRTLRRTSTTVEAGHWRSSRTDELTRAMRCSGKSLSEVGRSSSERVVLSAFSDDVGRVSSATAMALRGPQPTIT